MRSFRIDLLEARYTFGPCKRELGNTNEKLLIWIVSSRFG